MWAILIGFNVLRRNIIANFAGRIWAAVSAYAFVPFYLKLLGSEAYGLVGFFATLSAILMLADLGMSATLSREMARISGAGEGPDAMGSTVRTFESVAAVCMLALCVATWIVAPTLSGRWLNVAEADLAAATLAIRLMAVATPMQLMMQLYTGGMMGKERQIEANLVQGAASLARGLCSVTALWLVSPTIEIYASAQVLANAAFCLVARRRLLSQIPVESEHRFSWKIASASARYSAAMAGMTFISVILTQMDKLIVSRFVSLEHFGFYSIAAMFAGVPKVLATAVGSGVFPRMTALVAAGRTGELRDLYYRCCVGVSVLVVPLAANLAVFAKEYIAIWTQNPVVASSAEQAAIYMLAGEGIQALLLVPYFLALAYGAVGANLVVAVASAAFLLPALIFLVGGFGIAGGGAAWAIMNGASLPIYMAYLHRRFGLGSLWNWYRDGLLRPGAISALFGVLGWLLAQGLGSNVMTLALPPVVLACSLMGCGMCVPEGRRLAHNLVQRISCHLPSARRQ